MKKQYTLIDIFSGIGGFHTGFLNTNRFNLKLAVDFNKECEEFHKLNYPELPFERLDLSLIDESSFYKERKIKDIDVLIGGPPCQGFSTIGNRASSVSHKREKYDIRNNLIGHFINHVRVLRPKFFLMENVRGLTTYRNGDFFEDVLEEFNSIPGYNISYKIMNAADYGVPQIRYRTFVFGNRIGYQENLPPDVDHSIDGSIGAKYKTVGDVIMDLIDNTSALNHIPLNHGPKNIERYKYIPEGGRMPEKELPKELYRKNFGNTFKRLSRFEPSLTMVPGHNAFPIHPILHRSLTVREAARIQTFADHIIFTGNRQSQCIQVGNAVPPLVAKKWAEHIIDILDKYDK